jgi:hypothetical protein
MIDEIQPLVHAERRLSEKHFAELRASGLSDETPPRLIVKFACFLRHAQGVGLHLVATLDLYA